jgi:Putative Fe-S cluster
MKLTREQSADLLHKFWSGQPVPSPATGRPLRAFFVDRTYKPQVVMIGTHGEHFRFDQKPRQIVFSAGHIKSMVRDAKELENPVCPQDFEPLVVKRTPAVRFPSEWDWQFYCEKCFSFGVWEFTDKKDDVAAIAAPRKDAPAFHDETIPLPKRMEMAKDGDLFLKIYAAMAQTDCTACGYDCEGYAKAIANGTEKNISLCVPGKQETEDVIKGLMGAVKT